MLFRLRLVKADRQARIRLMPVKSPTKVTLLRIPRVAFWVAVALPALTSARNGAAAEAAGKLDFNFQVRPILADRCFKCHGPDEKARKAKLRLDLPETAYAFRDKDTGKAAVVPGHPEQSELCRRIVATDDDDRMPPPASNLSLNAEEKELLRRWVVQGAEYKPHWAFIPVS